MKRESTNVKGAEGIWEGLQGVLGWGKWCSYIITSKNKREFREAMRHQDVPYWAKHTKHRPPCHVVWGKSEMELHAGMSHTVSVPAVGARECPLSANLVQYCLLRIFSYTISGPYFKLTCVFLHYLDKKNGFLLSPPRPSVFPPGFFCTFKSHQVGSCCFYSL